MININEVVDVRVIINKRKAFKGSFALTLKNGELVDIPEENVKLFDSVIKDSKPFLGLGENYTGTIYVGIK